jgi:large subunit ribosomal protein L32
MPLPKRRHSNTRTRLRRTHYKLNVPVVVECPRCHKPMQLHHACSSCGFHKGRPVLDVSKSAAGR